MQNHYETLGLSQTASAAVIRATYLRLLQVYHPDHNADENAANMTRRIVEAYKVLGTPASRAAYDESLASQNRSADTHRSSQQPPEPVRPISVGCQFCGRLDTSLRQSVVFKVASFLLMTKRWGTPILACERCRTRKVLLHTAVAGTFGWWGFPWGPIYTGQALYHNARGGKSDPKDNAALLRLVGYCLYKENRVAEAKQALRDSLALEHDQGAEVFLRELGGTPSERKAKLQSFTRYDFANGAASTLVVLIVCALLYWYNDKPSGYEQRFKESSPSSETASLPVVQTAPAASQVRREVNSDADQLAALVERHATVTGHHYEGNVSVTDYELDRSKYASSEFKPLADRLQSELDSSQANNDGFVSSTYFNARLMEISIDVVNSRHDQPSLESALRKIDSLADESQVAAWLSNSIYNQPFRKLRSNLATASRAAYEKQAVQGGDVQSLDAMKSALSSLREQSEKAQQRGEVASAVALAKQHDSLVEKYNRIVVAHNALLKASRRLDHLFNTCLDPKILMSKFQNVNLTRNDPDALQEQ